MPLLSATAREQAYNTPHEGGQQHENDDINSSKSTTKETLPSPDKTKNNPLNKSNNSSSSSSNNSPAPASASAGNTLGLRAPKV